VQTDFQNITELPGVRFGLFAFQVICLRYKFASGFVQGKRVLEVGCGPGVGLGYLAGKASAVIGGDLTDSNIRKAHHTYGGNTKVALLRFDGHSLPFSECSFNVVLVMAAIYYLNLEEFLRECKRVLHPNGLLIFCTPNKEIPGFNPGLFTTSYHSPPEISAKLNSSGFRIEMYGAFCAQSRGAGIRRRLIASGGKFLRGAALPAHLKAGIKKITGRVINYQTVILPQELTEADFDTTPDITPVPIPTDRTDASYRVHYCLARISSPP